jgi:oligoribonuclease NrnB/cAMP/cGMP phosphodiesterase (DHH superfamily)
MHKIFYHESDLDGHASAAIYALRKQKYTLHPVDYGKKFPWEVVEDDDIVVILDFCPDDPEMIQRTMERVPVFYWIDHHKSSRKMYKENNFHKIHTPPGQFITDSDEKQYAACELTYMFVHDCEYKDVPYYVRLLGRWDVWDKSDPQTDPFQYAMKAYLPNPIDNLQQWKKLIRPTKTDHKLFQKLIEAGKYIKLYEDKKNAVLAKELCFEMEFEGYKTLAINRTIESSNFFKEVYNPKFHDLILQFAFHGDFWKLSFRSDKKEVDCAKIAEKLGAGGHAAASGAVLKELPKEIKDKINVAV